METKLNHLIQMSKKLHTITIALATLQMYQMQLTVALVAASDMNEGGVQNLNFLLKSFSGKEEKDTRQDIVRWVTKYTSLNYSIKKKKFHKTQSSQKWDILDGLNSDLFISANAAKDFNDEFNCYSINDFSRVISEVIDKIKLLEKKQESVGKGDPLYSRLKNTSHTDPITLDFKWPTTIVCASSEKLPEIDWPQVGMLQAVGYVVGRNGLSTTKRRELLSLVMSQQLPFVKSKSYRNEWGEPNSMTRLKKLANSIATFTKLSKLNPNDTSLAINDWESDLSWLKERYYNIRHTSWKWPR